MHNKMYTAALGFALLGTLATGSALAQQQVQARVVSATYATEPNGRTGYNVTYEYQGREYNTFTDNHPGSTIPVDVSAYGVITAPVAPQSSLNGEPIAENGNGRAPWEGVVPERGVVVSSARPPAPAYYAAPSYPAPVYMAPRPVYVAPAYGYGYGYAPAYAYPPVGLSLNLGYSRGWGGHRGHWR
ncbi:hypothetical protein ACSFA0_07745 [Variovorax sp. LT1P1]|uniref:hypothetical protein n=1 Tax=Variovorax sp. LT1P1 TaxID=3443730 RepID=UPI003F48463A